MFKNTRLLHRLLAAVLLVGIATAASGCVGVVGPPYANYEWYGAPVYSTFGEPVLVPAPVVVGGGWWGWYGHYGYGWHHYGHGGWHGHAHGGGRHAGGGHHGGRGG